MTWGQFFTNTYFHAVKFSRASKNNEHHNPRNFRPRKFFNTKICTYTAIHNSSQLEICNHGFEHEYSLTINSTTYKCKILAVLNVKKIFCNQLHVHVLMDFLIFLAWIICIVLSLLHDCTCTCSCTITTYAHVRMYVISGKVFWGLCQWI